MNEAAYMVYIGGFLVLPPALLSARVFDKARMPWILLLGVSVIGGWLLVNLAQMFYVNSLLVKMAINGNPVSWDYGGLEGNDFLLTFGWLFGPAYLLPWLILYGAFLFMRWLIGGRRA
jgi:hypothetical protein